MHNCLVNNFLKTPLRYAEEFSFERYHLLAFEDPNSVIYKMIVGGLASLFEGKRSAVAVVNDSPVDCQSRDRAARRRWHLRSK